MTDAIIFALRHELAGWGPANSFGGLVIPLNAKVTVWIGHRDGRLFMELAERRPRHMNSNWEMIWECQLEDPTCFDRLVDFLRVLPDRLATINPIWAIDP